MPQIVVFSDPTKLPPECTGLNTIGAGSNEAALQRLSTNYKCGQIPLLYVHESRIAQVTVLTSVDSGVVEGERREDVLREARRLYHTLNTPDIAIPDDAEVTEVEFGYWVTGYLFVAKPKEE